MPRWHAEQAGITQASEPLALVVASLPHACRDNGKVTMKDDILNKKSDRISNETIWAFDLGKGSIGEAVRRGNEFLHKASLLIPAEFAETKTAAGCGARGRHTVRRDLPLPV